MSTLPFPLAEVHYADPSLNDEAQALPITPLVDRLVYPTLGAPALLTADRALEAIARLPEAENPATIQLDLVDRHGRGPTVPLPLVGAPMPLGAGPAGKTGRRVAWQLRASLDGVAPRLYDLRLRFASGEETQPNAVRVYAEIRGDEKVAFCGDSQLHRSNSMCLARFVDRINARDDIAWVALIGDVCDNNVCGEAHMLALACRSGHGPVEHHYAWEYPSAREALAKLNKPVVLVPGNHDGMAAYEDYACGAPCDVYLGSEAENRVAYDGLHHFRRTFGPLFHRFDWHRTRYLAINTFELDRQHRLGYHAVVANWGGWVRPEQAAWIGDELADGSGRGLHHVALMHHDPRGGSQGAALGYYNAFRPFTYTGLGRVVIDYLRYLVHEGRRGWQQEWMRGPGPLSEHPVRGLLETLLRHRVWAVIMGHDNLDWVDSYREGQNPFIEKATTVAYPVATSEDEPVDRDLALDLRDLLKAGELAQAAQLVEQWSADEGNAALHAAIDRLEGDDFFRPREAAYAPGEVEAWGVRTEAPIHFVHVDDVGAYRHSKERHFARYGYVVAQLHEGRPVSLVHHDLRDGAPGKTLPLVED